MLNIKNLTLKNFLSIGNVTQSVAFSESEIYLIIGENLDLGGNDNRNGVGKTSILNGLSYALYGKPLVNIKLENLINKTNGKQMMTTIDFEKDGNHYRIERGRKPVKLNFFVNNQEVGNDSLEDDETQGENRLTQKEIERVLGISHSMFKNIIALNTFSEPFLSMRVADQREIIEQLLGITKLTEKADHLKETLRVTKENINEETFKIKAVKEANKRIEANILDQEKKSKAWIKSHEASMVSMNEAITQLKELDINQELENHRLLQLYTEQHSTLSGLQKDLQTLQTEETRLQREIATLNKNLESLNDMKCHTCGQDIDVDNHASLADEYSSKLKTEEEALALCSLGIFEIEKEISTISLSASKPSTFYKSVADAYEHLSKIKSLEDQAEREKTHINPYVDNIETLRSTGLQDISYDLINELENLKTHQEFLLKLLTNKDSFIRKKIINQNLAYLNKRLEHYLVKIGLPHTVVFLPDLSVEIQEHGRDLDFDNLSRGERTRLILSLSWAFRDVFESLNSKINLLFIDELIDNGLDVNGVESALGVLKTMARENSRCIHLISHRDELMGRVDNVLSVIKEGGFTTFSLD